MAISSVAVLLLLRVLISVITANVVIANFGNQAFVNYGNVQSLGQLFQLAGTFGQSTSILRQKNNDAIALKNNLKRAISNIVFFLPFSIFFACVLVLNNLFLKESLSLIYCFLFAFFFISLLFISVLIASLSSTGRAWFGQAVSAGIGMLFLCFAYFVPGVEGDNNNAASIYMLSWACATIIAMFVCCFRFRREMYDVCGSIRLRFRIGKEALQEGLSLMLMPAASVVSIYIVRLLMSENLPVEEVAQWQIAILISGLISFFSGTIMGHVFTPAYVNSHSFALKKRMIRRFLALAASTILIVVPSLYYLEDVLSLIFPSTKISMIIFFQVWIVGEWVRVINWIFSSALIASKREMVVLKLDWCINFLFVLGVFFLAGNLNLQILAALYLALCISSFLISVLLSRKYRLV